MFESLNNGALLYYKLALWAFDSGELKINNKFLIGNVQSYLHKWSLYNIEWSGVFLSVLPCFFYIFNNILVYTLKKYNICFITWVEQFFSIFCLLLGQANKEGKAKAGYV